jgi:ribosomal protein L29
MEEFGQKSHYDKHMRSLKHKQKIKPDLAKQLADLKLQQMENKTKIKIEQIENTAELRQRQIEIDLELRQKQEEIKEKIKEELIPERVITQTEMLRTSQGIDAFKKKLLETSEDTIQDYCDIINGVQTFQEIFKRDFSIVYEDDKVIVVDKAQHNVGYWINNAPCHEFFYLDDKYWNGLASVLDCILIYFRAMKKCVTEEGFKTEYFKLEDIDRTELREWITQEITFIHSNA